MKDWKFALDRIFLFMIFVSLALFLIEWKFGLDQTIVYTVQGIDTSILTGYYVFFANGLLKAQKKLQYCKQHWIMMLLLVMPFVPFARLAQLFRAERIFSVGLNSLWHLLDEFELL